MNEPALWNLNQQHQIETSSLDEHAFHTLLGLACHVGLIHDGSDGFLIAMNEQSPYPNPNFNWFKERYERFVYIDRIIIHPSQRQFGHARRLYEELFEKAIATNRRWVTAEITQTPPNPGSDAFHQKLGFIEVGTQRLESGKLVRMVVKPL
jgi:predicted GNAT superfamily acetyltransferase